METILNNEEVQRLQPLPENIQIRERHNGVRGNDPQRSNLLGNGGLHDVWISQPAPSRNTFGCDLPKRRQLLAILRAFETPVAWQAGSETRFASAHGIALAGDGKRRSARSTNVPRDQRQVVNRADGFCPLRAVVDTHRPADEGG